MDTTTFLARVAKYQQNGHRLLMINATALPLPAGDDDGAVELTWSFEKGGALEHLRERVLLDEEVPSVSAIYPFAYLYENDLRELFGVKVTGLNVDFKGQLYQTSTKVPFSPKAIRARLEATQKAKAEAKAEDRGQKP
jgi:ech hydrogenase subunit D